MKAYVMSLAAGLMVGVIYSLINVRSPAPPAVALIGLLGILVGEQIPGVGKTLWLGQAWGSAWLNQVQPHVFGHLPKGRGQASQGTQQAPASVPAEHS